MIGDPDLAKVNLDQGEFLLFLHQHLAICDRSGISRLSPWCARLGARSGRAIASTNPIAQDRIGNTRWASYTAFEIRLLTERARSETHGHPDRRRDGSAGD